MRSLPDWQLNVFFAASSSLGEGGMAQDVHSRADAAAASAKARIGRKVAAVTCINRLRQETRIEDSTRQVLR